MSQKYRGFWTIIEKKLGSVDSKIEAAIDSLFPSDLRFRYIFALCSIALVLTLGHVLIQASLANQSLEVAKIRSLDRLVPALERFDLKLTTILLNGDRSKLEGQIDSLSKSVLFMELTLDTASEDWPNQIFQTDQQVKAEIHISQSSELVDKLKGLLEKLENDLNSSVDFSDGSTTLQDNIFPTITLIEEDSQKLHREIELALVELESSLTYRLDRFKWQEFGLLMIVFLLLVFQGLYVFRPGIQKMYFALKVRSDFLSRIGHEIRNPMNAILGISDLLMKTNMDKSQVQLIHRQKQASRALLELLNNLLVVTEIDSKKTQLDKKAFSLTTVIDDIVDIYSVAAFSKGLSLKVELDPGIPSTIYSDEIKLKQILMNLVGNAIKFTDQGEIGISLTRAAPDQIKFEVRDTGTGIESHNLERIFDSFSQEDSSVKRKYGGSGLGLYIADSFVALLGGDLSVESEPNQGARFYFYLSVESEGATIGQKLSENFSSTGEVCLVGHGVEEYLREFSAIGVSVRTGETQESVGGVVYVVDEDGLNTLRASDIPDDAYIIAYVDINSQSLYQLQESVDAVLFSPFRVWNVANAVAEIQNGKNQKEKISVVPKGLRILVADDSTENRFIMTSILEELGARVTEATNGKEAVKLATKDSFDLILMDIQMPVYDGYEAVRDLVSRGVNVPVVAVTAHDTLDESIKIQKSGFAGHLIKPIDFDSIENLLAKKFKPKPIESSIESKSDPAIDRIEAKVRKMIPKYILNRENDVESALLALENSNFKAIKTIAHRMKGNAKSFGLDHLSEVGGKMELAAEREDTESLRDLIANFNSYVVDLKKQHGL